MNSRATVNAANKNAKGQCRRDGVVVRATPRLILTLDSYQGEKQSGSSQVASKQYQENINTLS